MNGGVQESFVNEKRIELEILSLVATIMRFAKQTDQWLAASRSINTAIKAREKFLSLRKGTKNDIATILEERGLVELFAICHTKMEEVVQKGVPMRLVAFNLGYLPGGDKALITRSETTLQALEAAKRMLAPRGLISIVVYLGHPGGRDEYKAVQAFDSGLPVENWICCKLQMLNRPLAPILVLVLKR